MLIIKSRNKIGAKRARRIYIYIYNTCAVRSTQIYVSRSHLGNEDIDESQRIASDLLHLQDPVGHVRFDGDYTSIIYIIKAVDAGVLVGEGSAHPRLHVAELEPELLGAASSGQGSHLVEGFSNLVDSIAQHREAVMEGGGSSAVSGVVGFVGEVSHVEGHVLGAGEAHAHGYSGQPTRVTLYCIGIPG